MPESSENPEPAESPEDPEQPEIPSAARRNDAYDYDVLVIGSGFGGAVSALRLSEKGYRVGVLEAGQRFTRETLPASSWDLTKFLWAPALGLYGIQRIHLLSNVMILAGAGVGGGSLNYANTLYVPPPAFFQDRQWGHITDWQEELKPFYDQARRMLGVRLNPTMTPSDVHLRDTAERMGIGDTFHLAPVGVFFGDGRDAAHAPEAPANGQDDPGSPDDPAAPAGPRAAPGDEVPDPYFGGAGPARRACVECGECMTGCRHGAKNTLMENYLYLAEQAGAVIHPMTTVVEVREERPGGEDGAPGTDTGFLVSTVPTAARRGRGTRRRTGRAGAAANGPRGMRTLRARRVVIAAGTYGTQSLLHRMRDSGVLPRVSDKLGFLTRTNSEALVGAQTIKRRYRSRWGRDATLDFTRGVAITSSIHPNENTHIEPVRYGRGSNAMSALTTLQVPQHSALPKPLAYLGVCLRHPVHFARSLSARRWSERIIIGLVMQSLDNSLTTHRRDKGLGKGVLTARQGHGAPNPVHIPEAAEFASTLAGELNGFAGSNVGELMGT
ncbi:GMC family oxidoreductase, partial [Streptomyces sp. AJS327]|uniref:FAD-binding protein n=1 Tax=Streptomyces sp. AJS327 TaxID=2545265 RepID=UPI0015DDF224